MKLAFLGADQDTLEVAHAAAADARYQVPLVALAPGSAAAELQRLFPRAEVTQEWETLIDSQQVDAIVVAASGDSEDRAEMLRKLLQASVPLLVAHPIDDSMLIAYELDMIRQETGCIAVPLLPAHCHPAVDRLRKLVQDAEQSPLGAVEQVVMERALADRGREQVKRQFAIDVDLARALAGELNRLSAVTSSSDPASWSNLGVQLTGEASQVVRWTVGPPQPSSDADPVGLVVQLRAAGGAAKLVVPERMADAWQLHVTPHAGAAEQESFGAWHPGAAALETLEQAITARSGRPNWVDAARSIELADTIERSIEKGRTIELYYGEYSEENTFRGTMASVGCALLLVALFLATGAAMAAAVLGRSKGPLRVVGQWCAQYWMYPVLAVLVLFLLLQLLQLVFPQEKKKRPRDAAEE